MEVGRGFRIRTGSEGNTWDAECIIKKETTNGLASWEPGQEGGSQESKDDRCKATTIESDNLVGEMLALENDRSE